MEMIWQKAHWMKFPRRKLKIKRKAEDWNKQKADGACRAVRYTVRADVSPTASDFYKITYVILKTNHLPLFNHHLALT